MGVEGGSFGIPVQLSQSPEVRTGIGKPVGILEKTGAASVSGLTAEVTRPAFEAAPVVARPHLQGLGHINQRLHQPNRLGLAGLFQAHHEGIQSSDPVVATGEVLLDAVQNKLPQIVDTVADAGFKVGNSIRALVGSPPINTKGEVLVSAISPVVAPAVKVAAGGK